MRCCARWRVVRRRCAGLRSRLRSWVCVGHAGRRWPRSDATATGFSTDHSRKMADTAMVISEHPAYRVGYGRSPGRFPGPRYTLATKLANELVEAADERQLARPSPATAGWTCSASTSWAICNSIAAALRCYSRFSPSARKPRAPRLRAMKASPAGQDVHRSAAVRCDRGPFDVRRQHRRNRYRVLPPGPRPRSSGHHLITLRRKRSVCTTSSSPPTHPIPPIPTSS